MLKHGTSQTGLSDQGRSRQGCISRGIVWNGVPGMWDRIYRWRGTALGTGRIIRRGILNELLLAWRSAIPALKEWPELSPAASCRTDDIEMMVMENSERSRLCGATKRSEGMKEEKRAPTQGARRRGCRPFKIPAPRFPEGTSTWGKRGMRAGVSLTHRPRLVSMTVPWTVPEMCDGPKGDRCLGIQLRLRPAAQRATENFLPKRRSWRDGALGLNRPHFDVAIEVSPKTANNTNRATDSLPGAGQVPLYPTCKVLPTFPTSPTNSASSCLPPCQRAGCPHNLARIRKKSSAQQSRSRTPSPRTSAYPAPATTNNRTRDPFSPWSTLRRMRRTGRCRSRRW